MKNTVELCLRLLEKLCRKRPSPLLKGRRNTWAAGIVYAIAANNFIFDKSMPIHLTADELSRPFGIAPSTAGNKAAEIRKLVRMSPWDTEWLLQELIEDNPAIWMLSCGRVYRGCPGFAPGNPTGSRTQRIDSLCACYAAEEQTERLSEKADNPVSNPSHGCVSDDSASDPAPPADFSDIYDRFRTV
jgi:hypothetical protein